VNKKGILSTWTPEQETYFQWLIDSTKSFAERYMISSTRNFLKYDSRSRESKKAMAKLHLMLVMASDEELTELELG
jgi:hypothetical protein